MKKIIFGLCVSLLLATSASAATKEEKARELLALEDIQATLSATINRATIPLTCRLVLTQQEEEKLKEDFMKIGNFQGLINSMIPFFTENYTEAELDDILTFYKSETGKKMKKLQPQQAIYIMKALEKWQEEVGTQFYQLGVDYARKHQQRSGDEIQSCIQSKLKQ